jgi:UDP-glucose 4-epimerase
MNARAVLVTGASGYIGRKLIHRLAQESEGVRRIVALDVREQPRRERHEAVTYQVGDVRDADAMTGVMRDHSVDTVVHLASIVTPGKGSTRQLEYEVDVMGTRHVLDACLATAVKKLIVTSSGAAYGYHADNPSWLDEKDPIRGNEMFPYAHHKRLVEGMLAEARREHPELAQLIFRPGTILGVGVRNQITALFENRFILGIAGAESPFVLIWDEDVVACLLRGIREPLVGVYNIAGDGVVTLREIARRVGRRFVPLPAGLLAGALRVLHPLRLSRYRPEQVDFIRYRPVLSNRRLKEEFGYTPQKTSSEVFDFYWSARREAAGAGT